MNNVDPVFGFQGFDGKTSQPAQQHAVDTIVSFLEFPYFQLCDVWIAGHSVSPVFCILVKLGVVFVRKPQIVTECKFFQRYLIAE